MKTIKAVIVDDEFIAREIISKYLSEFDEIKILASCKNTKEVEAILSQTPIDLLFLDINMPGTSGIVFAREIPPTTKIIFTTAHREYAIDGFDLQAVDYLLKPISIDRLRQAIEKFKKEQHISGEEAEPSLDYLILKSDRRRFKASYKSIYYVESFGDYIKVHTSNGIIVSRETISSIELRLEKKGFIRIHRSFVVSIDQINQFSSESVEIRGALLPISRSYRKNFIKTLTDRG
jgi:DNA-binding LytR/AlgR family response regulator